MIAPFSAAILGWLWAPAALACTLFEEPRSFNTQTFRLAYPDDSLAEEPIASEPRLPDDRSLAASANDPYGALPLSTESQQIVFIGNQPNRMFQVVVTDTRRETLAALRTCVLDAFATQTRLGRYIQVGSFTHRSEADQVSRQLERAGYPTRVIHVGNVKTHAVAPARTIDAAREKRQLRL